MAAISNAVRKANPKNFRISLYSISLLPLYGICTIYLYNICNYILDRLLIFHANIQDICIYCDSFQYQLPAYPVVPYNPRVWLVVVIALSCVPYKVSFLVILIPFYPVNDV